MTVAFFASVEKPAAVHAIDAEGKMLDVNVTMIDISLHEFVRSPLAVLLEKYLENHLQAMIDDLAARVLVEPKPNKESE